MDGDAAAKLASTEIEIVAPTDRSLHGDGVTLIAALNDRASICLIRHIIMPHRSEIDEISDPRFDDAIHVRGSCPRRGGLCPVPSDIPSQVKSPAGSGATSKTPRDR